MPASFWHTRRLPELQVDRRVRVAVFIEGNDVEWGTPVLYLGASDFNIFDLAARLAGMVSTNAQRTLLAQPHPAYWQQLNLEG